jgi:molybdopterin synthase catalytic subunit
MGNSVCEVLLVAAKLETPEQGENFESGAIVDFWGVVRRSEDGREIKGIDYEVNRPMAEHQFRLIAETAVEKFQLNKVIAHHRIGFVAAGEASLWLQVAAGHRAAAFEASKWIVDELKKRVPIWKRPVFANQLSGKSTPYLSAPAKAMSQAE